MTANSRHFVLPLAATLALTALARPSQAQEEKKLGWFDKAELTFVLTAGNAESSTFGLKNTLERVWERSSLRFDVGGIRTESSITTRTAVGPSVDDFQISEQSQSDVTAESYFVRGRYDRSLSPRFFLFGGAGWDRNTFAGIDNRYVVFGGVGNTWLDTEMSRFRTDYGVTYTRQEDVVDDPNTPDSFAGFRLSYDYQRVLTSTTEYVSTLVVDDSFDDTEDVRADFVNSIAVSISRMLALKTSLQLLFDNKPSLAGVPLEFPAGSPTGETVFTELNELDSILTVALVVTF